ncbi:AraC family transcriptional regulator [Streptomyces sp. NPDC020875]|uniref:helix-turn-helix transcriptional regulator n=1 Tax=Streptomyces sp. NPDC020875 TaxID=3154898 RepID=UPI0033EA7480
MGILLFESDDLEVTETFLSEAYTRMRIGSSNPAESRARVSRYAAGPVSVDLLRLEFEMSYRADPLGRICLCSMHSGTISNHAAGGISDTFGPGDVVSLAPPDRPYAGRVERAGYHITLFDPDLLSRVASNGPREPGPVRLTGHRPHSADAARGLQRVIGHLRSQVLATPAGENPLVVSTAAQYLAASVLHAFPHTAVTDPTAQDRSDARPAALRRAIAYLESHADQDISVGDVAAAAHVTVRALQYAFRRHLDTTPMRYLRRVRLAEAHAELLAADPGSGATVAATAARWGFAHPGRFTREYRAAYGRGPAGTLRD